MQDEQGMGSGILNGNINVSKKNGKISINDWWLLLILEKNISLPKTADLKM
jgi:hypothetical protein